MNRTKETGNRRKMLWTEKKEMSVLSLLRVLPLF